MKAILLFFKGWLILCFTLTFFVVPMYLVAIYPDVPEPYQRLTRSLGYGVIRGPASELGFWYRTASCGLFILLGLLILRHWFFAPKKPK